MTTVLKIQNCVLLCAVILCYGSSLQAGEKRVHPENLDKGGEIKKKRQSFFHTEQASDDLYLHEATSDTHHMISRWESASPLVSINSNTHRPPRFEREAMFFLKNLEIQKHSDRLYLLSNAHACDAYGNTILHQLVLQYLFNKSANNILNLIKRCLNLQNAQQLLRAKNMMGKTALHYAADNRHHTLALLLLTKGGKTVHKAITPEGETYDSLIGTAYTTPLFIDICKQDSEATPLMQAAYRADESDRQSMMQFYRALEKSTAPAYVTNAYNSALSLCRSALARHAIRDKILAMRRVHIRHFLSSELRIPLEITEELLQYANII